MKDGKALRLSEVKEMIRSFCAKHLNEEMEGYALKLCDELGRKRKLSMTRGKKEIWAASIVYAIARLNFLFDKENENYITADTICDFFEAKKSTVGNKATQIENACSLRLGAEGYCSKHITDSFSFVQTPDGFIFPKSMLGDRELAIEFIDGEEAEELNIFAAEQRRIGVRKAQERKAPRCRINRNEGEHKKKKGDDRQRSLFDDY